MGRVARYKRIKSINKGIRPEKATGKKYSNGKRHTSQDTFGPDDVMTSEGDIGQPSILKHVELSGGIPFVPRIPKVKKSKKGRKSKKGDNEQLMNAMLEQADNPEVLKQVEEQGGGRIVFKHGAPTDTAKAVTMSARQIKKRKWAPKRDRKRQEKKRDMLLTKLDDEKGKLVVNLFFLLLFLSFNIHNI